MILLASGVMTWHYVRQPERFPLRSVEVHGSLQRTTRAEITTAVSPHLQDNFFTLDVGLVQASLKDLPWVAAAAVSRRWPDRLVITVREHQAVARFGEAGILNSEGRVFYPGQQSYEVSQLSLVALPQFIGPESESVQLLDHYRQFETLLKPGGLTIKELHLAPHGAWQMVLNTGLQVILGNSSEEKLRLRRFVWAYQAALEAHSRAMAYIDLRYSNGLAVGWKPETVRPVIGEVLH